VLLNGADVRLVRGCSKAARGASTLMNVQRIRRCATTARVETSTTVTCVTVTKVTLVQRVVSDAMQYWLWSALRHNLPSPSALSSF